MRDKGRTRRGSGSAANVGVLAGAAAVLIIAPGASSARAESPVKAAYRAELSGAVESFIGSRLEAWLELYSDLHANPELSLQEFESARKMAERLEGAGYTVTRGVGGTGVVGVLKNGEGPTLLIRGDMDALPIVEETGLPYASRVTAKGSDGTVVGVMHACGHDAHQTCLVGVAEALVALKDRWSGTLVLVAQPAEEIGKGAKMMIEDGLFERFPRPDYCLALHVTGSIPVGTLAYTSGWALANVDSVDITIHGRGGHGSRPHEAADPIVAASQTIVALQTVVSRRLDPTQPGVITVGSIHAGTKHNIIPGEAKLQLTVRSFTDEARRTLLDGIREVTTHTCRAHGCPRDPEISVIEDEFTPALYNDPGLTTAAAEVFRQVLGPERVLEITGQMGGEDFGRYSRHLKVPGLMFWLGSADPRAFAASKAPGGEPIPSTHSSRFAPEPRGTIQVGVRCMTSLALSLLSAR